MLAEIVSIGTEILMGEIVDTNSAYLASELAELGIDVQWVSKVGDDPDRLFDVVDRAWRRSDVTLTTGGLGPTSDDLTRETIARAMGEEMAVQEDLLEHLKAQFAGRGAPMPSTNIKQATLIPSAKTISNPMGTAPGWLVEKNGHLIVAMPGPPRELQRMWTHEVAPELRRRNPDVAIVTRTLKTFGISEGGLNEMVATLFESENPSLGIYSKQDGIHLRAIATAPTEGEARRLIAPMEAEIREVAGDAIWGEDGDTPDSQVASLLTEAGQTLGVIEAFTGGLVAAGLAGHTESERFLKGSFVAVDQEALGRHGVGPHLIELHGMASAPVAEAMAEAARQMFGADVGLAVTGSDADNASAGTSYGASYIGFAVGEKATSVAGRYPGRGMRMRQRVVTHALLGLGQMLSRGSPISPELRR
jgi:nicotinamide-nucleotide amidase